MGYCVAENSTPHTLPSPLTKLACADAVYGIWGQIAGSHALIAYARAVVGELEVQVGKAKLAAGGGQVGGVGGEYVQEETGVRVAGRAGEFEIRQGIAA